MKQVNAIKALDRYRLWLSYTDGVQGVVDLSHLVGQGIFALWDEPGEFEKVQLGPSGDVVWNEQIDMCPDALYLKLTGKKPEDIFPRLHELLQHAGN